MLGGVSITAFVLSLLGAHRRIGALKRAKLEQVQTSVADTRTWVLESADPSNLSGGRLTDLVAYETRISSVTGWPIDATTLLRPTLYLAIGFGSWIGAALVE